jgi:mannose-1-phosphate guanylyltransferase/mannose-6-phosphate isomerase
MNMELDHDIASLAPAESPSQAVTILPVILCGGAGTRLWPLSREHVPKQLLPLIGDDTLLQETLARLDGLDPFRANALDPLVICNEEHRFLVSEQLRSAGRQGARIMLEPSGRNTAPALTLAALQAVRMEHGKDAAMVVMPADHLVRNSTSFCRAILDAARCAMTNAIVTLGVVPTHADTGYGYIRRGHRLDGDAPAFAVTSFVEKPDAKTAAAYLASGEYFWNGGIFVVRPCVWLALARSYCPDILAACERAMAQPVDDGEFIRLDSEAFLACPGNSVDYAVMEHLDETSHTTAVVVPLDAGWSDIGAWDAVWAQSNQDQDGNVLRGDALVTDTHRSLVLASGRLVACVGVDDLVVVDTPDAVLVASKSRAQDVRQLVGKLKTSRRSELATHRKTYRPWGSYDSVDSGERFQVKRLVVKPGATLSLQMHHHRAEHWIVVRGTAQVTRGDETFLLSENQSTYIPLGVTHRLSNPGKLPLELIEVQSGSYLGEDDIVRFDDLYGRIPAAVK